MAVAFPVSEVRGIPPIPLTRKFKSKEENTSTYPITNSQTGINKATFSPYQFFFLQETSAQCVINVTLMMTGFQRWCSVLCVKVGYMPNVKISQVWE